MAHDLDGDRTLDLVTAGQWTPGEISVMVDDGAGGFADPVGFAPAGLNAPSYVVGGDYDNDGDVDVIVASPFSDNFALYLNQRVANAQQDTGVPDLSGEVRRLRVKNQKGSFQFEVEVLIHNTGSGATGGLFT